MIDPHNPLPLETLSKYFTPKVFEENEPKAVSLFKIERNLHDILDSTLEDESLKNLALVNLSDALARKTDQVAHYRESLKNFEMLLVKKIEELKERKTQIENKIDRFDQYVLDCMSINEKDSFEGEFCKIKKRKPQQAVEIFDEKLIPLDYIKIPEVKPMIMKAEIAKALKQGEVVEGARLIDGKTSLIFGVK